MRPLQLRAFTATSALGRGLAPTLAQLRAATGGLRPCNFETVRLDTWIGEVGGVEAVELPAGTAQFACRNNRLAWLALSQDGFAQAVAGAAQRHGADRVGLYLGTSTSGILESELAYRRRDPATGALPADFRYEGAHNTYSVGGFVVRALDLQGPAA
ncbi:MAG TPA: hypothetical protein VL994_09205, partial [Steroidobacteraceae bacterium]|nr:hypothetical protein [Steroidobacteraceae bacterium]